MAQGDNGTGHFGGWRRIVAGLAVVALILQGLSLFSPASRAKSPVEAALSGLPGAQQAGAILCLNADDGDSSGKAPVHRHDPGACPMCQVIGASLAAVAATGALLLPLRFESAVLVIPPGESAPRTPPQFASSPRGPPATV